MHDRDQSRWGQRRYWHVGAKSELVVRVGVEVLERFISAHLLMYVHFAYSYQYFSKYVYFMYIFLITILPEGLLFILGYLYHWLVHLLIIMPLSPSLGTRHYNGWRTFIQRVIALWIKVNCYRRSTDGQKVSRPHQLTFCSQLKQVIATTVSRFEKHQLFVKPRTVVAAYWVVHVAMAATSHTKVHFQSYKLVHYTTLITTINITNSLYHII